MSSKPRTPPPDYDEPNPTIPAIIVTSTENHSEPIQSSSFDPIWAPNNSLPPHHGMISSAQYGPTPILRRPSLLPYYDPRSPHSIQQARERAYWRFIVALAWAVLLWIFFGWAIGVLVGAQLH